MQRDERVMLPSKKRGGVACLLREGAAAARYVRASGRAGAGRRWEGAYCLAANELSPCGGAPDQAGGHG